MTFYDTTSRIKLLKKSMTSMTIAPTQRLVVEEERFDKKSSPLVNECVSNCLEDLGFINRFNGSSQMCLISFQSLEEESHPMTSTPALRKKQLTCIVGLSLSC